MENEDDMKDYGKVAKSTLKYAVSCVDQEDYWWRMHWRNYFKMFQGALGHLICEIYGRTFIVPENDQTAIKHLIGGNECFTNPIIVDESIKRDLLSLDEITFDDIVAAQFFCHLGQDIRHKIGDYNPVWTEYLRLRKSGKVATLFDKFAAVTASSRGLILYYEQIEEILTVYFGFSKKDATELRIAFGLAAYNVYNKFRPQFFKEGKLRGYPHQLIKDLWEDFRWNHCRATREALLSECWLNYQYSYLLTYNREAVMSRLSKIQNNEEE